MSEWITRQEAIAMVRLRHNIDRDDASALLDGAIRRGEIKSRNKEARAALRLADKINGLPPLDPSSRHPGLIDDTGRLLFGERNDRLKQVDVVKWATNPAPKPQPSTKGKGKGGGRPEAADWDNVKAALEIECGLQGGVPAPDMPKGWRTIQDAMTWVREEHWQRVSPDDQPAQSTLRTNVSKFLKEIAMIET
jgi:hypothetical protein